MQIWLPNTLQRSFGNYDYLTLHRVPGPRSFSYFLPVFLTFACLLVPPSKLSFRTIRYVMLPAIIALQCLIWMRNQSFDVISMQITLTSFALLGWYDVRRDFQRIQRSNIAFAETPYPSQILKRIKWIASLIVSIRFTDYLIRDPAHDHKQRQRKNVDRFAEYLLRTFLRAIFSFILLDITTYLIQGTSLFPCLSYKGHACENSIKSILSDGGILFIHVYAAASFLLAHLPSLIILLAISPFSSLRYHPSISPVVLDDIFGPFSSLYQINSRGWGLRAFWGKFWHQNLRYVTVTPGLALATLLQLPKRSFRWYMTITSQAFFWSGCIHAGMVPPLPLGTAWPTTALRLRVASFFWVQPVGIIFECMVDVFRRVNAKSRLDSHTGQYIHSFFQALALAWTSTFILVTLWATVLPVGRELGWWRLHPIPFSVSSLLVRRFCKP